MTVKHKTRKHWLVLIVVSLMFSAFAGINNNTIGVFYSPVAESLGILRGSFALHSTITLIVNGFVSLIVPKVVDRFGWKPSLTGGAIIAFIGAAGMAFTENLLLFYLLGGLRGLGSAFFGMVPMAMILNNWFYEKNGLALSLASGLSGLTGMVFAPIFSSIIQKTSWEIGFIAMGLTLVGFVLPAILYPFKADPRDEGLEPYGYSAEAHELEDGDPQVMNIKTRNNKYITITFIALLIFAFLNTNVVGINQHFASYGESIGMSTLLSGYLLSAVSFGNLFFKLALGPLSDKFGAVTSTVIMTVVNMVGLALLVVTQTEYATILAVFFFGSAFSIGSVALPLLSTQFFGRQLSSKYFPVLSFGSVIGVAFSNTIVGYIFDFTGSYQPAFLIAMTFQIINLLLVYISYKNSLKTE